MWNKVDCVEQGRLCADFDSGTRSGLGLLPRVPTVLLPANRHESQTVLFCAQWLQVSPDRPQDLPGKVLLMWLGPSPWQHAFLPCPYLDFESAVLQKMTDSRTVFIPSAQQKSKSKLALRALQSYLPEAILNSLKVQSTPDRAMWNFQPHLPLACLLKNIIYFPRTIEQLLSFPDTLTPCSSSVNWLSQEAHYEGLILTGRIF